MRWIAGLALVALPLASVTGQAPTPTANKDAGVATVLSVVIPGGGQYYAEEPGKGLAITAISVFALGFGIQKSHGEKVYDLTPFGGSYYREKANYAPLFVGAVVASGAWLYGVIDAPSAARRTNERRSRVSLHLTGRSAGVALVF